MRKRYTDKDILFLKEHYPDKGINYCSLKLKRTKNSIQHACKKLNLKVIRNWRSETGKKNKKTDSSTYRVNHTQFINPTDPTCIYILGLIWADGYVDIPYSTQLATTYPDANFLIPLFLKTGGWKHYDKEQKNHPTWKTACTIKTSNRQLVEFLIANDYGLKSSVSADKILSLIPEHLHHYWIRGLFDGDGHIYTNKNGTHRISFSGSYEQNWNYLAKICNLLEISYTINREIRPDTNYGGSTFTIYGMYRVIKFCNFMYDKYPDDNIGLHRKYKKLLQLKSTEEKNRYKGVCFSKSLGKWRTYTSAANKLKPKSLGMYNTKEEALEAVNKYYSTNPKCYMN